MESSQGGQTVENETSVKELRKHMPLYNAALKGDWETANTLFFEKNIEDTQAIIFSWLRTTPLHVAVLSGRAIAFVRKLVQLLPPEALALKDANGNTALHHAATVGNTEAAAILVEKYSDLLYIKNDSDRLAVTLAALFFQKQTLEYLISVMCKPNVENNPFEGQLGIFLFTEIIGSEFLDVALDLVEKYPDLARLNISNRCPLSVIAEMESVFPSRVSFSWWEKFIYLRVPLKEHEPRSTSFAGDIESPTSSTLFQIINGVGKQCNLLVWRVMEHFVPGVKDIKDKKKMHKQALNLVNCLCREMKFLPDINAYVMLRDTMFRATEHGISEIVEVIMDMYPIITDCIDNNTDMNIMHLATLNRFENIFNQIYSMSDRKRLFSPGMDKERNTILHMCGRLAPPDRLNLVPGAALQMQRELQWFNEVQRFISPSRRNWKNKDGKTPKMLFTEEHKDLKEQGEKWMKDTANACSIASALIATVVFAAAFTIPGGLSSDTGIPFFSKKPAFVLFATTNAASLFTSITSLMMFLSILTSRYAEKDFLHVLPKRLCFGLLSLFISILFMLVAFSAALYLGFRTKVIWFIIPVATFGWWPVASFVLLQFPLLVDVAYSTFGPGIFGKKTDRFIY